MKLPGKYAFDLQLDFFLWWENHITNYGNLPFLGSPLNIRRDFSAFSVRPLDASQDGDSGIGINNTNATTHMAQLIALTKRQFVYIS